GFNFENRGSQNYKGFDKALSTYRLARKTVVNVQKAFMGEMFGRQVELNSLLDWVQPILQGEYGHVAYLYGEAGMGKSRLAYALQEALGNIVQWHTCPCDQILKRSLNPFWSFLRYYFRQSEENTPERNKALFEERYRGLIPKPTNENREDVKKDLEQAIPIIGEQLGLSYPDSLWYELEAKGKYENTLYGIVALFLGMSLQQPVVIELEDLHWIDSDSLELLKRLTHIANLYNYPIFVLCTSRYNAQNEKPILQLQEDIQSNTIDLNYWKEAILDYYTLQQISGKYGEKEGQLSQSLKTLLQAQTKGNPFFAQQLVTYLLENDLLHVKEQFDLETAETYQEWELKAQTLDLPQGIQGILMARIDQLSQRVKEVVKVASVLGREFEVRLLNAVLEREVAQELKNAEQEEIWSVVQQLQGIFKHGLLRDAAYNMQLKDSLQALHLLAAQSMEEIYKDDLAPKYADICYHYQQTNKVGKKVEYARKAGNHAFDHYEYEAAIHFYTLGLEGSKSTSAKLNEGIIYFTSKKIYTLDKLSSYQESIDLFETTLALYQQESGLEEYELRYLYYNILHPYMGIGSAEKGMEYALKAIELIENKQELLLIEDYNDLTRFYAHLGSNLIFKNKLNKAFECLNKAKEIAEKFQFHEVLVGIYKDIIAIYIIRLDLKNALATLQKSQVVIQTQKVKNGGQLWSVWGRYYRSLGDFKQAKQFYAQSLQDAIRQRSTLNICGDLMNIGICCSDMGNSQEAIDYFKKALTISKKASLEESAITVLGALSVDYNKLGDRNKALTCAQEALRRSRKYGSDLHIAIMCYNISSIFNEGIRDYPKAILYAEEAKALFESERATESVCHTLE
ncbi:MAG: tetratricopeptide repeat protein, partial [Chitinophagales bacterium]